MTRTRMPTSRWTVARKSAPLVASRAALDKQLRILLRQLPRARRGGADDVHRARVATRRLREILPVAAHAADSRGCSRLARDVRRITRALGPVREIDVALKECALEGA